MLSKRLQAICDFVTPNSKVVDIGADHGLVDIYLTKNKNCQCLATDISAKSLEKAKENIKKAGVSVKTLVTDGLEGIELTDETLIISGMGTHTILKILNKKITNDLVICTHNKVSLLRNKLQKKGYYIKDEKVIFDKFYYVIGYYKYGQGPRINNYVSPFLINNIEYMRYLLNKYQIKFIHEKKFLVKLKYHLIIKKIKKHVK